MESASQSPLPVDQARGKKDPDGTVRPVKLKPLKDNITDLCALKEKHAEATARLAEKVKSVAEQTNLLPSVVRKLINARVSDHYERHEKQVEQLQIVFADVGKN